MNWIKIIIVFVMVTCFSCKTSYSSKGNYSVTNKVVFIQEKKLVNNELFNNSKKNLFKNLKKSVIKERQLNKKETDTLLLNNLLKFMSTQFSNTFADSTKKYEYYTIRDSLIVSYTKHKGKILGDYTVINKEDLTSYKLSRKDSTFVYDKRKYQYNSEDIEITEFRDSIKTINKLKCFKVLFSDIENISFLEDLPIKVKTNYELYVTDQIDLKTHPFFRYKKVLDKYFPMEIYEYNNFIDGVCTYSSVKNLK